MKEYTLSGAQLHSRKEFHQALAQIMPLPEWYGANLDALMDVLTDIAEDSLLVITEIEELSISLGTYYKSICKVLKAASEQNPHFTYELKASCEINETSIS